MAKNRFPEKSVRLKQSSFAAALRFLSYRARSAKEIREKLRRKWPEEEVGEVIKKLRNLGFINDTEFAKTYIESRSRTRPRSRKLLELELKRKGVTMNDDSMTMNDYQLARLALEKKKNLKSSGQAIRFLQSRGFSWEVIEKVLKLSHD